MNGDDRYLRIAVAFARTTMAPGAQLCRACIDVLEVSGAGISVMTGEQAGPLFASNARMRELIGKNSLGIRLLEMPRW